MSLIEPNSKIFLIKNLPLNNAYKHTIYLVIYQRRRFTSKVRFLKNLKRSPTSEYIQGC